MNNGDLMAREVGWGGGGGKTRVRGRDTHVSQWSTTLARGTLPMKEHAYTGDSDTTEKHVDDLV